ncbi:MAG: NAD(P)-dependent oxidoreductase [Sphingopyxis macrogoltabida]|uniref:NAD(P)-dependent oxidoreductase n=1 Tax=Sphingopyxis macrogoltabida TaxID=33050 RepID=A0A2W5KZE0_SPHMC|nr:MAG: NAD(P)-dependent oxidoreductase [Sphingopyxis macrogoltabida]
MLKTAFIGYGEAGAAFAGAPAWTGLARTFDIKFDDPAQAADVHARCRADGVGIAANLSELLTDADAVISVVTADQAVGAAQAASRMIGADRYYLDFNSVAPATKRQASAAIEATGSHYIDVAVMAPVRGSRLSTPLLVSGPEAERGREILVQLGFQQVRTVGVQIGDASAIKMLRSIVIKGIEALTVQCLLAADRADVVEEVLTALGSEWVARIGYNLERVVVHGERRAAELDEVALMLDSLDMPTEMVRAAAAVHRSLRVAGTLSDELQERFLASDIRRTIS